MLQPKQVLDRYYPEVRAWLIQIAAVMDRYERAGGGNDERLAMYHEALKVLQGPASEDRAEKIQMIYSDPYEAKTSR